MGRRGPQPTPTNKLKIRGSWRGNENPDEPMPEMLQADYVPDFLSIDEQKVWKKILPTLLNLGLATELDEPLLVLYCVTKVRYERAVRDPMIKHTELASYASTIVQIAAKFGMSPADRRGMSIGKEAKNKENTKGKDKGRFFKGG